MIRTEADLHRANVRMAWSFADRMTVPQFEQLCRVTVAEIRRDAKVASGQWPLASSRSGA